MRQASVFARPSGAAVLGHRPHERQTAATIRASGCGLDPRGVISSRVYVKQAATLKPIRISRFHIPDEGSGVISWMTRR